MPSSVRRTDEEPMPADYRVGRPRAPDVDRHVGARMRERRIMLGLTQQQMAELIGVTYQQAHKYEKGSIGSPRGACTASLRRSGSRSATSSRDWARTTRSRRRHSSVCSLNWRATSSASRNASTKMPSARWRAPWPSPTPGTEPRVLVAPERVVVVVNRAYVEILTPA